MKVQPEYKVRFIPERDVHKLVNLYHLARTALADRPLDQQTSYNRMLWAADAYYCENNKTTSRTGIYKDLSGLLGR